MTVRRLLGIPGFGIDRVASAAGKDPDVLRMENLDTDLPPPAAAIAATKAAVGDDNSNSYLPFEGDLDLRRAVANHLFRQTRHSFDLNTEIVITCGGTEGMFDALLATVDAEDEVVLTDPTYAGMINRVRLAGAKPKFVPWVAGGNEWHLDLDALGAAINPRTRALLIMNPSMPSGAVLNEAEWNAIANICRERSIWLLYNAAMERILFDGRLPIHPVALDGMREWTITIGSVSKEYRMIGWRIGWVAGPAAIIADIARVHIYNVVSPTGIAQSGARAALEGSPDELALCIAEWQRRRDTVLEQLRGLPLIPAAGGWSMLLDVGAFGHDSHTASALMLEQGRIAATPMRNWGERSDRFVRLVFSNEPIQRLATLRERMARLPYKR